MERIGIIGGGFSGTMLAVHLIHKSKEAFRICLIDKSDSLNLGVAYKPNSKSQILNVIASKMSAFPDKPDHFLDWTMRGNEFKEKDKNLIANSFLSRQLYGEYLKEVWAEAVEIAELKNISVELIDGLVIDLEINPQKVTLTLDCNEKIEVGKCVIASGNHQPGNLKIKNPFFCSSKTYFRNPWLPEAVSLPESSEPILIIGSGLTMVDTVLGLIEQGFKGDIFSISPNGLDILPHRHIGIKYSKLSDELPETISLYDLVKLVHKHIKLVGEYGFSAEPVIDSIRPFTARIWRNFSEKEKASFVSRLKHLWNVGRHRIPLHIFSKIQQLQEYGQLHCIAGKIINITETEKSCLIEFLDKNEDCLKTIETSRIINCTGPETNLENVENSFLKNCLLKGIVSQDRLKLGIRANIETFEVINSKNETQNNLYTIGSKLRGELWESIAVNELRSQAESLAQKLID
ncbi:MAG: FAD/NAD(P)-binding protein [Bacteroidales bacterium]